MPKTSIYLNNKDILLSHKEIKRFFKISQVSLNQLVKTIKLNAVSIEGKRFYKLTDIQRASAHTHSKEVQNDPRR